MKLVLDTNVLVSALLTPHGKPARVLELLRTGQVTLCLDPRILSEYEEVLKNRAFPFDLTDVDLLLDLFRVTAFYAPIIPLSASIPDPDDAPFIEVAIACRVDVLVTGNKRHFPRNAMKGTPVMTPGEFLEYRQRSSGNP